MLLECCYYLLLHLGLRLGYHWTLALCGLILNEVVLPYVQLLGDDLRLLDGAFLLSRVLGIDVKGLVARSVLLVRLIVDCSLAASRRSGRLGMVGMRLASVYSTGQVAWWRGSSFFFVFIVMVAHMSERPTDHHVSLLLDT